MHGVRMAAFIEFHPLSRSAPRHCLPLPRWKTSTFMRISIGNHIGRMMLKTRYGWIFYVHLWAAKNLYISKEFVPRIAPDLKILVGGKTTEVLPTLENIFLEHFQPSRPFHEGIEKFVAARRLTSRPVAVSDWDGQR
jgi:hypothetical protein